MRVLGTTAAAVVALLHLPLHVLATDVLKTDGYSLCSASSAIKVQQFSIQFDRSTKKIDFNVAGTSEKVQNVTASLVVSAYGKQVYEKDFKPCDADTYVKELCPLPSGDFAASGSQSVSSDYADMIPSIAFSVPDLEGDARLELKNADTNEEVACIESGVTNGKTIQLPAVSYAAVGIIAASLALSGLTALGTAGHPGSASSSPGFGEVVGWFQTMATGGMLSVPYPPVYRNFASNFAFTTGLVPWSQMQNSIDNFRNSTGGNLTENSYKYLLNSNLTYDGDSSTTKRALSGLFERALLFSRDVSTSVNGTGNATANATESGIQGTIKGIAAYSEQLSIPSSSIFMTVLLFFALVIAAIAVGILLLKVILETWALYGSFPASLTNFRKHYWGLLGRTVTNLILVVYGIWVIYCVYQFTRGDSWAATLLAALTLAAFTAVLVAFTVRIAILARRYKKSEGDAGVLYEDQKVWRRYSLFYDNYKKDYWFIFVPAIIYMLVKGCIIAGGDGHGLVQTGGQLVVESLMLILLLWTRPYVAKSGQWINLVIQVVRVLSVVCILIFVQELGFSKTTKTITGIVLIAVQSTLTGILAILIAINALINCIRTNPHAKLRQNNEKGDDFDNLTALDARNSLLMDAPRSRADVYEAGKYNYAGPFEPYSDHTPASHAREKSTDRLISRGDSAYRDSQQSLHHGISRDRSPTPEEMHRQPQSHGVAY
ncbi:uncharacterized protein TRUGW13939_06078 [Talaromyces rugulosus]|uniref:ML-like domain-containing protein n=1 Tax=Talaromyces rugulosus TaxID=121627 RepID=A0A7H8QXV0_TALRU|nr:uncharacterized protein TRUGW13939_06078 [Talaromyces rugulosus]QKX58950.1 hypothetical protein TRUGW13939_06078 [Talaromyces rugulosus]